MQLDQYIIYSIFQFYSWNVLFNDRGATCVPPSRASQFSPTQGKSPNTSKTKKDSSSGSDDSDGGEAQNEILKQIKFPEVEREQSPASLVGAICRCLSKQADKVGESINKLEKIENKSVVQSKFHGPLLCLLWSHGHLKVVRATYLNPTL